MRRGSSPPGIVALPHSFEYDAAVSRRIPTSPLPWDEIRRLFPDHYVLLDELILDPVEGTVRGGRVFACGLSRREVFAAAPPPVSGARTALKYTGELKAPVGWTGLALLR